MVTSRKIERWRHDPFRPLDFRWQDACRVVAGQSAEWADRNDPVVRMLVRYQRSLDQTIKVRIRREEKSQFAAVQAAQELAQGHDLYRGQVEALILAGATDDEVAKRCSLAPATIGAYEAVFFTVRHCLTAFAYLITRVVGHGPWRGFQDDELRQFLCWSALAGGLPLVDALVEVFHAACRPGDPPHLHVYFREDAPTPSGLQAFVAGAVVPPERGLDWAYIGWHVRLLEAGTNQCPAASIAAREDIVRELVEMARELLTGKPIPEPRRQSGCKVVRDGVQGCLREGANTIREPENGHLTYT